MKNLTIKDLELKTKLQGETVYISDDILDAYLIESKNLGHVMHGKTSTLKKILKACGNKISTDILNKTISSFNTVNNTKNLYVAITKPFLKWLNTNLGLNFNPKLLLLYERDKKQREPLTRNELAQIIDMLDVYGNIQFKIAFLILATNGMRLGELCSVNWNEEKGDSCYIKTEKTGRIRTAWISPQVRALLDNHIFKIGYNSIQEYFRRFRAFLKRQLPSFNKRLSAHVLRHTVATMASENGLPIETISKMLGHEDTTTTLNVYIHGNRNLEIQNFKLLQLKAVDVFNNQLLLNENRLLRKLLMIHGIDLNNINNYLNQAEWETAKA